jgi:hypothetical protein
MVVVVGVLSVVHRTMVRKIYETDGRSLSTFSLPMAIRREYKARFGKDRLYWFSQVGNVLFGVIVLLGIVRLLR